MRDNDIRKLIRTIPDFPKPGIQFRDVTTLFADAGGFQKTIQAMSESYLDLGAIDKIVGIEARGFILGAAIAGHLGIGFIPLRKKGKLPGPTYSQSYSLEYGEDALEIHRDALAAKDRVVLVDDLIATGGTAKAGIALCRQSGANVLLASFLVDLPDLKGREAVRELGVETRALLAFGGE